MRKIYRDPKSIEAKDLCWQFNQLKPSQISEQCEIIRKLLPNCNVDLIEIRAPFQCDFGDRISIGADTFINHDCYFADLEPIRIGKLVRIGRGVTILGGVSIGDGAIIESNSVVTKDIPANSIAVGNPAKIVRKIFTEM